MHNDYILCSSRIDLGRLDRANLRMHGIMVSEKLDEALQPILEGEATTLLLTSKAINEQSSLTEISKYVDTIFKLNKPNAVRFIYLSNSGEKDSLVHVMDTHNNWDVYYNTDLSKLQTEDIVSMFQSRKSLDTVTNLNSLDGTKSKIISRSTKFLRQMNDLLEEGGALTENTNFKAKLLAEIDSMQDVILASKFTSERMDSDSQLIEKLKNKVEQLTLNYRDSSNKVHSLEETIKFINESRDKVLGELRLVQTKYNKLVEQMQELVNVSNLNSLEAKIIDADRYIDKAPLIVYFKEYTPISYFTTFLTNLSKVISETLGLSKVLIIENDSHVMKIPSYVANGLTYVTDGTNMAEVVLADLVTLGNNDKLNKYMVQNSLNLDILFVVDRTGVPYELMVGKNVINFKLIRNWTDKDIYKLSEHNIISNDPRANYVLPKIKDFDKFKGNSELELSVITSLDISHKISQYIKSWNETSLPTEFNEEQGSSLESELIANVQE